MNRLNELIGHLSIVGCLHCQSGRQAHLGLTLHNSLIGSLHSIPAIIAVHGVIPARNSGDGQLGLWIILAQVLEHFLQLFDVSLAAGRGHVAAIHKAMHMHRRDTTFACHGNEGIQMLIV